MITSTSLRVQNSLFSAHSFAFFVLYLRTFQGTANVISQKTSNMGASPPSKQAKSKASASGQTQPRIKKTSGAASRPNKSKLKAIQKAVTEDKATKPTKPSKAPSAPSKPSKKLTPTKGGVLVPELTFQRSRPDQAISQDDDETLEIYSTMLMGSLGDYDPPSPPEFDVEKEMELMSDGEREKTQEMIDEADNLADCCESK